MYPMLVAIVIVVLTSIPLIYLPSVPEKNMAVYLVYPLVACQGVGISIMLNTSTSLISDVIGSDAESSAFVYGAYSLFDKFSNGILLYYIVATHTEKTEENEVILRYIMGYAPIITAVSAYIFTFIGQKYYSHKLAKLTGIRKK